MKFKSIAVFILVLGLALAFTLIPALQARTYADRMPSVPLPASVNVTDADRGQTVAVVPPASEDPGGILAVDEAWVDDDYNSGNCGSHTWQVDCFNVIQDGINAVNAGGRVNVAAGTYTENLWVNKSLELAGAGAASVTVYPAVSIPVCSGGSLCGSRTAASNIILAEASDIVIHGFTLDGDNPLLTSGVVRGGADLDARNGIIEWTTPAFNNLTVYETTVRNIYLRGIYPSSGGSGFNIHHNTVDNVQGEYASIAIFSWMGSGTIANNMVSNANDAISANHSRGIQFLDNTVTNSGSGVHTDNAGDGGGVADLIQGNNVTCPGTGYGVWVFVHYLAPTLNQNTVTGCDVGLSAWGQGAAVTALFTNNTVTGPGTAGSVGAYITTDLISWGYTDISVDLRNNLITSFETAVYLTADPQTWNPYTYEARTIYSVFYGNSFGGNTYGMGMGTQGTYNADASANWWGSADPATVRAAANGGSIVDYTPWLAAGTDTGDPGFQGDFSTLWVDDDSPQTGTTGRIQEGIDLVSGSTVYVAAGTYVEDPVIDKAVTLLGPNAAINPNTGTRVAEAVILPAVSAPDPSVCEVMVYIEVSDVTIRGFTFDGDNPALTSGIIIDGADVDACEILAGYEGMGNIVVENNILKHSTYSGIDFYNYTNTAATAGNYIRYNRFEDIGETTYNWGIGILIYNNFYADITDNVLEGVRTGIQTGNFYQANPGTTGSISNNQIGVWRLGIFHNLAYSSASPFTISGNTITAETYTGATKWNGLLLSSISSPVNATITNNTITIPDTVSFAPPGYTAGYNVWNVNTTAPIAISGGTVTGGDYGVFVNNYEGYSSNANNTAVTIDGVTVLDSNIAGVYVKDSPSNTNGATVYANIQNCTIDTDATGILIEGTDATAAAYHNRLGGNTTYGMNNTNASVTINAEYNYWGSVLPAEVAAEVAGTVDFQPWCNYDFTICSYVFPVHNLTQLIDYPTIQSAVDAANPGDVILADDGIYEEQVVINKNLTLRGASTAAIIRAPVSVPTCFTTSTANHPIVCITSGATVDLDTFTIDGAGRGNVNVRFEGIAFRNAGGTVQNCTIQDIRDTPFSGAQHGVAVYVYNDDETSRAVNVWDNEIYGFQKNAMALNTDSTTPLVVDVQRNIVTGAGTTTVTAQNGIQVWSDLGSGTVSNNTITGIAWNGTTWVASSVLNYYADLDINNNTISNAQMGIYNIDGAGQLNGNTITVVDAGSFDWGIMATDPPDAVPSPFDPPGEGKGAGHAPSGTDATLVVEASNNTVTFVGTDNTSTYGIEADAGYGPNDMAFTANGNTVTGFYVGIEIWNCQSDCDTGVFTSITAHNNCLSDNTYGMRSNVTYLETDGVLNWWDDDTGPYHPTQNPTGLGDEVSGNVDFEPWVTDGCGGTALGANWQNTTTGIVDDLQGSLDSALPGETIIPIGTSPLAGGGIVNNPGVTIDLSGKTVGPGSPAFTINADDVSIVGPGILDGDTGSGNSTDPAILVNAGADNFRLEGVEIRHWADGVELAGNVTGFRIGTNWIHLNTDAGLQLDSAVSSIGGIVTIEGNLFKANGGNGIQNDGAVLLDAEYNSWGDRLGPTVGNGDGVSAGVDYDPWSFIETFFDVEPDLEALVRDVPENTSFNVALKADAENVYALSFQFTYSPTMLTLNSTTFAAPWVDHCLAQPGLPAGTVGYFCYLTLPAAEWDADGGTIATFNFTSFTGPVGEEGPWTTYLDISHLNANTSAGAVGGVKIWVNNAGYDDPSVPDRDITDANDGQINIQGTGQFTGWINLQGRLVDSLATVQVYNQSLKAGATLLADATSDSGGAYTTAPVGGNTLTIGTTYWLVIDRRLYLPTTVALDTSYAHSHALEDRPTTLLATVFLLGGDATNDDVVDILDGTCIAGDYGLTSGFSTCGLLNGLSDVNEDGVVDILDMSLMGGNYNLNASPWVP